MADTASERTRIAAPAEQCLAIALDFERYPEWANDVKIAKVLERDADGRGRRVEYRAAALGRSVRYILEYDYTDLPNSFSWRLIEGDLMRSMDGRYRFEADGTSTRVHYDLAIDVSVPLLGMLKRRAAALIVRNALKDLRQACEPAGS